MRLRYLLLAFLMLACLSNAYARHKLHAHRVAQPDSYTAVPAIFGVGQLADQLNSIVSSDNSSADIAVYVRSMKDGQTLYTHNINQPLAPASTMKILTAEAALLYLGPEYRFSTQLLTDAKSVKDGVLQGNLYVVLSGDPTLTYDDIVDLLSALHNEQIQAINGNVYIDNTAYDKSFYGPGWISEDKRACYGAPISAGIVNQNCLPITLTPAKIAGRAAQLIKSPKYFYPNIKNTTITKSSRSRACSLHLSSDDPNSMISIDGCLGKGHRTCGVSYVVTDVPEYDRELVKSVLSGLAVKVYGRVTFGSAPNNLSLVGSHASKTLRELINEMLKKSNNIIAGALFKKLGQLYSHQPGSWENGSLAVSQILSRTAGVNTIGMRILDGSGLSPDNLTKPSQLMQVLDFAYHHSATSYDFISSLPIAGVDGTLKHRMYNISRKVRAKTGTISGVVSLAGYVVSGNNEPLAFVIMINGTKGFGWRYKSIEDKIATALTRYHNAST